MQLSDFLGWIFVLFLGACWIVTGGLMSKAAWYLYGQRKKDKDLDSAFVYAFWAAIITWSLLLIFFYLVYLIVAGTVLLFASGGGEVAGAGVAAEGAAAEGGAALEEGAFFRQQAKGQLQQPGTFKKINNFASKFVFVAMFILVIVSGILSAVSANEISKSSSYKGGKNKTVSDMYILTIISASVDLGAIGILIIGWIVHEVRKHKK